MALAARRAVQAAAISQTGGSGGDGAMSQKQRSKLAQGGAGVGSGKANIFGRLLEMKSMDEARRMVAEEGGNFSPANSSTALKRVAYLSQDLSPDERQKIDQEQLLAELRGLVDSKMSRMQPPQLADIIWAYGRMEISPGIEMLENIALNCEAQSRELSPADITKLMWGYAKLHFLPEGLLRSISGRLSEEDMEEFTAHSISNMVWACATLQYQDERLLEKLAEVSRNRLSEFAPQGLTNTLWGFATLRHRDQELMDGIATEAKRQLGAFTTKGLVNLLWCYGIFEYSPSQLLPDALEEAGKRLYKGTPVDVSNLAVTCARLGSAPPNVMTSIVDRADATAGIFQHAELTGFLWALGQLQYEIPPELQQKMIVQAGQLSCNLTPTEIANALYGLSRLNLTSEARQDDLQLLLMRACHQLPSMDTSTTSCTLQALARLSCRLTPNATLASFVAGAKEKLASEDFNSDFPMKDTVLLLWAFAKLEQRIARWYMDENGIWQEGSKRVRRPLPALHLDAAMAEASVLGCHDLALLIWACGSSRQPLADDCMSMLASRTTQLLGRMTMREVSMCVWGLAKMEHLDEDLMDVLAAIIEDKLRGPCCPQDVVMLLCSCAVLPYRNIPMIQACVAWSIDHIGDLSIIDICNTMWAMAELYYVPDSDVLQVMENQLASQGADITAENRSTMKWARRRLRDIDEAKVEQRQARRSFDAYNDAWMSSSSAAAAARQKRFERLSSESVWDAISRTSNNTDDDDNEYEGSEY